MTVTLTFVLEIGLCLLLAATLVYCVVLERRLAIVRQGQQDLQKTIGDLNASIATAGASLRALQAAAGSVGEVLERKVTSARAAIDELSLVAASSERIAQRMERSIDGGARPHAPARSANGQLPSGSVMGRLDALRAAR
jgi:Domain of unknown function (DUF6468)